MNLQNRHIIAGRRRRCKCGADGQFGRDVVNKQTAVNRTGHKVVNERARNDAVSLKVIDGVVYRKRNRAADVLVVNQGFTLADDAAAIISNSQQEQILGVFRQGVDLALSGTGKRLKVVIKLDIAVVPFCLNVQTFGIQRNVSNTGYFGCGGYLYNQ